MNIRIFSDYLARLDQTTSRLAITEILSDLFKKTDKSEIKKVVYLLLGSLAPRYETVVFNMADKVVARAIAKAYGRDETEITKKYKVNGDLGETAFQIQRAKGKNQNYNSKLTIDELFNQLMVLAVDSGEGSVDRKIDALSKLLASTDPLSAKYITRMVLGKLRLGFSDKTIIDALSWTIFGNKSQSRTLTRAYEVVPDVGLLAEKVKTDPTLETIRKVRPVVGIPVLPMLAARLKDPKTIIEKMGKVAVEPKIDGLRLQIHFGKGLDIKAFTRNLNEVGYMFPEIQSLNKYIKAYELILDCEAVGIDEKTRQMADFQTTMTRRRKHDIVDREKSLPVTFNLFDILLVDGKNLMSENYLSRRQKLEKIITPNQIFCPVENKLITTSAEILAENKRRRKEGFEGIMIKKIDSSYVSGRLGYRWVKMKEDEKSDGKLSDTVDCVVMGYSKGRGKRAVFGVGQFLVGVIDDEEIKTISKVGTGLTDQEFKILNSRLEKLAVAVKPKEYGEINKMHEPDVWVTPGVVVELAADDITKSPMHSSGFALRFPRLVRFRSDKSWREATTLEEINDMIKVERR